MSAQETHLRHADAASDFARVCRPTPLTASGGANAVNSGAADSAGAAAADAAAGGKSKTRAADAVKPKATQAKKRGLKRL